MSLTNVDVAPAGRFLEDGGFRIIRRQLPRRWDYLLAGPAVAVRFCQNGLVSLQGSPPAGRTLCESAADSTVPPLVVWIHDGEGAPFTHVLSPVSQEYVHGAGSYSADFLPGEVVYRIEERGWEVRTVFRIDPERGSLLARVSVANMRPHPRHARIVAAAATLNAPAGRHAWDPVGLYQHGTIMRSAAMAGVVVENRDPGGDAAKRSSMGVFVQPVPGEVLADRTVFTGAGSWALPEGAMKKGPAKAEASIHGVETVAAFAWDCDFTPRADFEFALALAPLPAGGKTIREREANDLLSAGSWTRAARRMKALQSKWEASLKMETPDATLDDYVETWLPRQLFWVACLDRGWATGLRGVRDAAQDFSAVAWIDPQASRDILRLLFSAQRRDGWFPRQVALQPSQTGHDLRPYVDSGCWVVELLHDYLRLTGDRRILKEKLPWLDGEESSTVEEHLRAAVDYYINPENLGPDNIALIRGGDWNDALHLAGLAGRGQSVMTSCQAVLALRQAAGIVADPASAAGYLCAADRLRSNIRRAALNKRGFLRGASTDDGRWLFSERDPDGRERINTAVQAWGIIAGVLNRAESRRVLRMLSERRGPHGFRLFHPPLGEPPIPGVGRVASGDLMAGVAENGTVYNHGSQAFLARAAAVAGDGDTLLEILRWALPCYTDRHPTDVARTPPYAIVNCWMETPGHDGEGGSLFLSGAVGVLRRVIIEGLLGFQPTMDGVRIDPCLPRSWRNCRYSLKLRGGRYEITLGKSGQKTPALIPWGKGVQHLEINIGGRP